MNAPTPTTFQLGDAQVSIINIGYLKANLAEWFKLAENGWPQQYDAYFAKPLAVPIQSASRVVKTLASIRAIRRLPCSAAGELSSVP